MNSNHHIKVTLANSDEVGFDVSAESKGPSYFLLGIRKSGSSVLNSICAQLAEANHVQFVDVAGVFFKHNIAVPTWIKDPGVRILLRGGNLYGGFRDLPLTFVETPVFKASRKILMVRDPRDALVSEYFSNAYSHRIPEQSSRNEVTRDLSALRERALKTSIDDVVLEMAPAMQRTLLEYYKYTPKNNLKILRYEDVILHKTSLIREIASFYEWKVTEDLIQRVLSWSDVVPKIENNAAFIRRVIPGDFKNKLKQQTIERLNDFLEPAMTAFGYSSKSHF